MRLIKKTSRMVAFLLSTSCMLSIFISPVSAASAEYHNHTSIPDRIGGSNIGYREIEISRTLYESNAFLAWHPDFPEPKRNASYYYFGTSSASMTVSFGGSIMTITFDPASSHSGYVVEGAPGENMYSRPALHGDVYEVTYEVGMYDFNLNRWTGTGSSMVTRYVATDVDIVIHKSTDEDSLK